MIFFYTEIVVYIYIYIYIYCNRQADCFVVSTFFIAARPVGYLKLRLKPDWRKIILISYPGAIVILSVSEGIFMWIFLRARYRLPGVLNSWEKLMHFSICCSREISPPECSTHVEEPKYCHPQDLYIKKQKVPRKNNHGRRLRWWLGDTSEYA